MVPGRFTELFSMHSQGEYAASGGHTITASAIDSDSNKKQVNAITNDFVMIFSL